MTTSSDDLSRAPGVPLYLQIAQQLRQGIYRDHYQAGHMLPSEGVLMERLGVSRETIRSALEVLRKEGIVETRRGAGTMVRHVPPPITVTAGPDDVIRTRMPTKAEREALGLAEAVPVLVVKRPGRAEEIFDGNRAEVKIRGN